MRGQTAPVPSLQTTVPHCFTAPVTAPYQLPALTYTEELRVHAVKVGHEDEANGSGGIEEEQEASREVKEKPTPVHHQQACQLLRQH